MKISKKIIPEIFLALLFSIFTILGNSFKNTDSWNLVLKSPQKSILMCLIYSIIYYVVIVFIEKGFYKIGKTEKHSNIFDQHPFLTAMLFILLFWIPWIIIKYPGTPSWDFYYILNYFHGLDGGITQHFPIIYQYFCGYVVDFGCALGNANLGLYILTLIHASTMLIAFSLIFVYFKKWHIDHKFRLFVLLFFALNPLFCNYATTIYHDVIYSSFVLIYILFLTDIVLDKTLNKKKLIILSLFAIIICFTRKNGIYLVIPTHIFIAFKYKKVPSKVVLLIPIILFYLLEHIFSQYYYETSTLEMLAIPIQTLSRYSKNYHDDISIEEKETINNLIIYDEIGKLYSPTNSDNVKNNVGRYPIKNADLIPFFRTWIKLFLRHPSVYVEAFLNHTYQLWYPFEKTTYIFMDLMDNKDYYSSVPFKEISSLSKYQKKLKNIMNKFESIPLLKYIDDPGYYTWFLIILLFLIYKNKLEILPLIPLIVTIFCCLDAPAINYHGRYAFPIIFAIFPLFAFYSKLALEKNTLF